MNAFRIPALTASLSLLVAGQLNATPIAANSWVTSTELTGTALNSFSTYGGLMEDNGVLYFGNYDTVQSYNLSSGSTATYATIGSNVGTNALAALNGTYYMSMDTSYSSPFPSTYGTFSTTGFSSTLESGSTIGSTTYSIYDAATYNGSLYFAANVGTYVNGELGPEGQQNGTSIFQYNLEIPSSPIEIARVGGYSGGITFDSDGNLYYASQNYDDVTFEPEGILKFNAEDLGGSVLTTTDATSVLNITASSIGFLTDGTFIASTGWGQAMGAYDLKTGEKSYDIATTSGSEYMSKFITSTEENGQDVIYVLSNDYNAIYDYSGTGGDGATLSVIAVPEASETALIIGALSLFFCYSRRRKA